jgi:hypothetical protein
MVNDNLCIFYNYTNDVTAVAALNDLVIVTC